MDCEGQRQAKQCDEIRGAHFSGCVEDPEGFTAGWQLKVRLVVFGFRARALAKSPKFRRGLVFFPTSFFEPANNKLQHDILGVLAMGIFWGAFGHFRLRI